MEILLIGGSGTLGQAIIPILEDSGHQTFHPFQKEFDIIKPRIFKVIFGSKPDIVIHAAAYTNVAKAEKEKKKCWQTNVEGTINIVRFITSSKLKLKKFVYISTDYVFDGQKGNYNETDVPNPTHFYGLTKLLGEIAVQTSPKHLIIRTSFKPNGAWPHPRAFSDLKTSADYIDTLAEDFCRAILANDLLGIIHIGGKAKTIFDLARQRTPGVMKMSIKDITVKLPANVTLDSSRWKKYKRRNKSRSENSK